MESVCDQDVFIKFHKYDFTNDETYQKGLQKIKDLPNFTEADVLKSKIFYFSKSFHKISIDDYKKWLERQTDDDRENCTSISTEDETANDETKTLKANLHPQRETICAELTENSSKLDKSETNTSYGRDKTKCSSNRTDSKEGKVDQCNIQISTPINDKENNSSKGDNSDLIQISNDVDRVLSLTEVADFIEKGLPLPGIKDLDIRPLEIDPQPSVLMRKLKPWEK